MAILLPRRVAACLAQGADVLGSTGLKPPRRISRRAPPALDAYRGARLRLGTVICRECRAENPVGATWRRHHGAVRSADRARGSCRTRRQRWPLRMHDEVAATGPFSPHPMTGLRRLA